MGTVWQACWLSPCMLCYGMWSPLLTMRKSNVTCYFHFCRVAAGVHSRPRPCCVLRGQDAVQNRYRRQNVLCLSDCLPAAASAAPFCVLTPANQLLPAAVEEVPEEDYEIPLGKARVVQQGSDTTLVGWGQQVRVLELAVSKRWRHMPLLLLWLPLFCCLSSRMAAPCGIWSHRTLCSIRAHPSGLIHTIPAPPACPALPACLPCLPPVCAGAGDAGA